MKQYLEALRYVLDHGEVRNDRTGVGTKSVFGYQMRFNLQDGFPAVTTKKLAWRAVVAELLWFLEGSTDERRLCEIMYGKRDVSKTTIWTANANHQGVELGYRNDDEVKDLGPIYGYQWRNFGGDSWNGQNMVNGFDQIKWLINEIKTNPSSRRLILSAWDARQVKHMALPPCHVLAQFHVSNDSRLSCQLYQRSVDAPLGLPFNIASYSLLTYILAQICGLKVGEFIHTSGDLHVYLNQVEEIEEQLRREPRHLPDLLIPAFTSLDEVLQCSPDDFQLLGYHPYPPIKIPFAV